jgi:hypothetical protein
MAKVKVQMLVRVPPHRLGLPKGQDYEAGDVLDLDEDVVKRFGGYMTRVDDKNPPKEIKPRFPERRPGAMPDSSKPRTNKPSEGTMSQSPDTARVKG